MDRGQRQHDERRVTRSRERRFPFYRPKYGGKTPGKMCSCSMCGNRRVHEGPPPSDRRRLQDDIQQQYDDGLEEYDDAFTCGCFNGGSCSDDLDDEPFGYVWPECDEPLCPEHGRLAIRSPTAEPLLRNHSP